MLCDGRVSQEPYELRIEVVGNNEGSGDEVLGEPPRQARHEFSQWINYLDNDFVTFSGVDPAMKATTSFSVSDHRVESFGRFLQVVKNADGIRHIETVAGKTG